MFLLITRPGKYIVNVKYTISYMLVLLILLQRVHPAFVCQVKAAKATTSTSQRKYSLSSDQQPSNSKVQTLVTGNSHSSTQAEVDNLIMDFITEDMQSFNVVDSAAFCKIITKGFPGRKVITRKTLDSKNSFYKFQW